MDRAIVHYAFALWLVLGAIGCPSDDLTPSDTDTAADTSSDVDATADTVADADDEEPIDSLDATAEADQDVNDIDAEDATDCSLPQEGCPCDPAVHDKQCCLDQSYGLECVAFFGQWRAFYDCGCSESSDCEGYPLFHHCYVQYPQ